MLHCWIINIRFVEIFATLWFLQDAGHRRKYDDRSWLIFHRTLNTRLNRSIVFIPTNMIQINKSNVLPSRFLIILPLESLLKSGRGRLLVSCEPNIHCLTLFQRDFLFKGALINKLLYLVPLPVAAVSVTVQARQNTFPDLVFL